MFGTRQTWPASSTEAGKFVWYPANLAGVSDALIFFCFLFFHQGKKRKTIRERSQRNVPDLFHSRQLKEIFRSQICAVLPFDSCISDVEPLEPFHVLQGFEHASFQRLFQIHRFHRLVVKPQPHAVSPAYSARITSVNIIAFMSEV